MTNGIPALGERAFDPRLDAQWLLVQSDHAPTDESREAVEGFAHDLATITTLPEVART